MGGCLYYMYPLYRALVCVTLREVVKFAFIFTSTSDKLILHLPEGRTTEQDHPPRSGTAACFTWTLLGEVHIHRRALPGLVFSLASFRALTALRLT